MLEASITPDLPHRGKVEHIARFESNTNRLRET